MTMWVIFAIMALGALAFLAKPLFASLPPEDDTELASYFAQIDAIQGDDNIDPGEAEDAIAGLQRQILDRRDGASTHSSTAFNITLLCAIGLIGAGVYFGQGRPDSMDTDKGGTMMRPAVAESVVPNTETEAARNTQLASLVGQLEIRLAGEQADDPNGWLIYARSLMSLRRFDEALIAYDRVLLLTEGRLSVVDERDRARAYIAQSTNGGVGASNIDGVPQRGPTEQDVRDAEAMSVSDRQVMIQGMVEGLAQRLEDDPSDPAGWASLIRARQVLGQSEQASADVARLRVVFADNPETVSQILNSAGWTD